MSQTSPATSDQKGSGWRGLAPRLLAVIVLMACVSAALAGLGLELLATANSNLVSTDTQAHRSFVASRANTNLVNFARGVEYLPLELTEEQRRRWEASAADEANRLDTRLQELDRALVIPASRADLAEVVALARRYRQVLTQVQAEARAGKLVEATNRAVEAAPIVAEARDRLRAIETRIAEMMERTRVTALEQANAARFWLLSISIVGVLVSLALSLWIVLRGVTGPLKRLAGTADALAVGQLDIPAPEQGRRDEVGAIARALETLRGAAQQARTLEAAARTAEQQAAAEQRQARLALAQRVETQLGSVMTNLAGSAQDLESNIGTLSQTAEEATLRASSVASAAGQASSNVQTVSAAAEQLAASVSEITRQVAQAAQVARQAVNEAEAADATVASLNEAAQRIGVVVRLIGDIAGQTNLLALNATIEAARAGDAGKGFAVVASEVKQLAGQTASATEEISQQITAIQGATEKAVLSIRGIAGVVGQVDQIAASIAAAVEEQGAATQEIARNVSEAALGTNEVSSNIGHVSSGMTATRDALGAMQLTTSEVARQNATLQGELEALTQGLRSA